MTTAMFGIAIVGLWLFLFHRKQFDFVSVAFFGALIYFSPGFYSFVADPYNPERIPSIPIYDETYYVWFWALGAMLITGFMYNPEKPIGVPKLKTTDAFDWSLIGLMALSFTGWYINAGDTIFSTDKFEVLENQDRFYILFSSLSQVGLVCFVLQGKWVRVLAPLFSVLLLLYIGFRYEIALAAIAIATHTAARLGIRTFFKPKYLLPLAVLAIVLLTYKPLLYAFRADRIDIAEGILQSTDFIQTTLLGSEPFIAQATLNEVLGRGFQIDVTGFVYSLLAIVPFLLPLLGVESDTVAFQFQEQLFPMVSYGLGSNIYSNFYAALGWIGILVWILAHCAILVFLSKSLARRGQVFPLLVLSWGAFFAFYVHRNDVLNAMAFVNRPAVALFAVYLVSRLLSPGGGVGRSEAQADAAADEGVART